MRGIPRLPTDVLFVLGIGGGVALTIAFSLGAWFFLGATDDGQTGARINGAGERTPTPEGGNLPSVETGVSDQRILFGQSAAFSGPAQELGINMRKGILAAFKEANDDGGVHGRMVELTSRDDAYEPEAAIDNTTSLIKEEGIFALIGAVGTPTSRSAVPVAEAKGVPYIAPFTGAVPLVHVVTHKGHGYEPTEDDPVKFHQPSSPLGDGSGAPTYSKVFAQTLTRLMHEDDSVVGISAAMLEGTRLVEARRDFPDRVFDVGIAEQNAVSMAAGMASKGLKPFVPIYSTFLQRAFDQVVHDVCIQNLPVTLIADRAGIVGEDCKTHHGAFDISYLRCLPNAVVAATMDENELQHLVYTAY